MFGIEKDFQNLMEQVYGPLNKDKMTETDISKVLIEGDYATIMGVKYKRVEEPKSPVEEAYKDWWGQYPELETDSKYDDTRWKGFKAGFQAAYEEKVREDDYYDEVECDEKDNPKPLDDVVNRLIEKHKSQKLWNILSNKYDYISATCDDIVSAVEEWLPKEQSAAGSQNVDTELLVDGFNHCVSKMKEMLR